MAKDLVPAIEERFGCGGKGRRGVFGKSSGGYGALAQAFTFPEVWDAAACHSGDMAFDLCYLPLMPDTLRVLARHEMSTAKFLDHCADTLKCGRGLDKQAQVAMMVLAMAATYAPNPDLPYGVELPVDLNTCEIVPERWQRWLDCEPEAILARRTEALSGLGALWIDCGRQDTANLLYGARRLEVALVARGVDHVYEEFEGGHSDTNYRFDKSLPFLAQALARNTEIVDVR